jgi:hypothetical protein
MRMSAFFGFHPFRWLRFAKIDQSQCLCGCDVGRRDTISIARLTLQGAEVSESKAKTITSRQDLLGGLQPLPFFCCRFRSRTPGPPPFSSMNSTPATSRAFFRAATVDRCAAMTPAFDSRRFIVGSDTDEATARSRCSQRTRARAALINSLLSTSAADAKQVEEGFEARLAGLTAAAMSPVGTEQPKRARTKSSKATRNPACAGA